ncbi:hypothetical protein JTB14_017940 [Gonioctena quinquepunctata]|nr:hypothetical protein JTB14_017940 [Gonioctena quinquepunctata]
MGSGNKVDRKVFQKSRKGEECLPTSINECAELAAVKESPEASPRRPSKLFDSSSDRSKRRKTEEIRRTMSTDELAYATRMSPKSKPVRSGKNSGRYHIDKPKESC